MNEYLVTAYIRNLNLTLTNYPITYWSDGDWEIHDPHWLFVIVANESKNETVDYLEYINAKNGYASLYELPKSNHIRFVL